MRLANDPGTVLAVLGVLAALLVYVLTRTTWTPSAPLRIARRRSGGQTLTATWRMYVSPPALRRDRARHDPGLDRRRVLQAVILHATGIGIATGGEAVGSGWRWPCGWGPCSCSAGSRWSRPRPHGRWWSSTRPRGAAVVRAAHVARQLRPLLGALAIAVAVVSLLTVSIFLAPIAIWLVVRWALLVPVAELEQHSAFATLRRSASLVRLQWFKVGTLVVVATALALVTGPLVGALLILLVDLPFAFVNVVAALLYAVAMPFIAITTTYVFFDSVARERLERAPCPLSCRPRSRSDPVRPAG